jgi:hypothetical protein
LQSKRRAKRREAAGIFYEPTATPSAAPSMCAVARWTRNPLAQRAKVNRSTLRRRTTGISPSSATALVMASRRADGAVTRLPFCFRSIVRMDTIARAERPSSPRYVAFPCIHEGNPRGNLGGTRGQVTWLRRAAAGSRVRAAVDDDLRPLESGDDALDLACPHDDSALGVEHLLVLPADTSRASK